VSLVLDASGDIHNSAGLIPWGLRERNRLPSVAAYVGSKGLVSLVATIDAVLQRGESRSLRIETTGFDDGQAEAWNCRVAPLHWEGVERVSLIALEDTWAQHFNRAGRQLAPGGRFDTSSSEPLVDARPSSVDVVVSDLKKLAKHVSTTSASQPYGVDIDVWKRCATVLRRILREGTGFSAAIGWVTGPGSTLGAVCPPDLKDLGPMLKLDLLLESRPPDSSATAMRRLDGSDRTWLGSLSRAASGRMQLDPISGLVSIFLPCVAPVGHTDVQTALLVSRRVSTRRHTQALLESTGFRVTVAAEPEEALATAKECHQALSLLVCDGSFPGLSGMELHDSIKIRHTPIKAIYLCGGLAGMPRFTGEDWAVLRPPATRPALLSELKRWNLVEPRNRKRARGG
jgi:CheY-like chemotaxis protein